MTGTKFSRKFVILGALAVLIATPVASRLCVAQVLPNPAARFIHFFGKSSKAGDEQVGLWERFVYSLILTTSAPTDRKTTASLPEPS